MTKARSGVVGNKISPSRVAVGAAGELAARGAWEEAYQKLAIDDGTIVDRGMVGNEFLQTSHAPEAWHHLFPPSERQVRIFLTVVQPAATILLH